MTLQDPAYWYTRVIHPVHHHRSTVAAHLNFFFVVSRHHFPSHSPPFSSSSSYSKFGCKNAGFVEAVVLRGAELHRDSFHLTEDSVVFSDGTSFQCDAIVACTGTAGYIYNIFRRKGAKMGLYGVKGAHLCMRPSRAWAIPNPICVVCVSAMVVSRLPQHLPLPRGEPPRPLRLRYETNICVLI